MLSYEKLPEKTKHSRHHVPNYKHAINCVREFKESGEKSARVAKWPKANGKTATLNNQRYVLGVAIEDLEVGNEIECIQRENNMWLVRKGVA